jgi:hypothetical protein
MQQTKKILTCPLAQSKGRMDAHSYAGLTCLEVAAFQNVPFV